MIAPTPTRIALLMLALLLTASHVAMACSPVPRSLYEHFSAHSKVFLGTVQERVKDAKPGQGVYKIAIEEDFKGSSDKEGWADIYKTAVEDNHKGFSDKDMWDGIVEVTLSVDEPCGLGEPLKRSKILVFMNDDDVVNITSGSFLIWSEAEQNEASLNPMMDRVLELRHMLFPKLSTAIVPDEDTAVHLALKTLIPIYGAAEVSKQMPLKAALMADKRNRDGQVWRVEGTRNHCPQHKPEVCHLETHNVEINKWSGDVVRVYTD